jgi:threonine dehydrogenase-like Zn-dependent dehydrogenase
MLAVTYQGPKRIRVIRKPEPKIEHPNDAILRVTRATICGSDLHLRSGFIPDTRVGMTFGHEFTGVVERVGPDVKNLQPGDRVMVPFHISCGTCFYCSRGLLTCCENTNPSASFVAGVFGYSHLTGGYDGGQAEFVRVPFADVGPIKIPSDMSDEDVLFLTDVVPTGYHAAEMGSIKEGETVAVFGCGPIGLIAQRSAWLLGAGRVIGIDDVDYRLEFARSYSGSEIVDSSRVRDVVTHLKDMTDGRGPDVCIDAVGLEAHGAPLRTLLGRDLKLAAGSATVIDRAIHAVRNGGDVVLIGVYGPPWNAVPIGVAMNKALTLRMAQCHARRYMPHMLEHVRAGRINAKGLATHRVPLEEAPAAYEMFANKRDNCVKIILVPPKAA